MRVCSTYLSKKSNILSHCRKWLHAQLLMFLGISLRMSCVVLWCRSNTSNRGSGFESRNFYSICLRLFLKAIHSTSYAIFIEAGAEWYVSDLFQHKAHKTLLPFGNSFFSGNKLIYYRVYSSSSEAGVKWYLLGHC